MIGRRSPQLPAHAGLVVERRTRQALGSRTVLTAQQHRP